MCSEVPSNSGYILRSAPLIWLNVVAHDGASTLWRITYTESTMLHRCSTCWDCTHHLSPPLSVRPSAIREEERPAPLALWFCFPGPGPPPELSSWSWRLIRVSTFKYTLWIKCVPDRCQMYSLCKCDLHCWSLRLLFCDSSKTWTNQCSVKHVHHQLVSVPFQRDDALTANVKQAPYLFRKPFSVGGHLPVKKLIIIIVISLLPDWSAKTQWKWQIHIEKQLSYNSYLRR